MEVRFRRRHRAERLTRSGLLFFLAIVGIGAVAVNSGNNLLYLTFSVLLSALIFSGLLSVANLQHLDIVLEPVEDIYAGQLAPMVLRVRNGGRFPLFFARISLKTGVGRISVQVPFVNARAGAQFPVTLLLPVRGRVSGLRADISSTFPFGIVEMCRDVEVQGEIIVYPAVRPVLVRQEQVEGEHRLERARAGGDGDFFSLRRYEDGEDARRIDWKVSARRGSPYVTEQEARYQREAVFYLDTAKDAWVDEQAFETAVSKIASALTAAFEKGEAIALALPTAFLDGRERRVWQEMMEALALVQLVDEPPRAGPVHCFTPEAISFAVEAS